MRRTSAFFLAMLCLAFAGTAAAQSTGHLVYIGTYTGEKSQGIYAYRFDPATGSFTPLGLAAETRNPSFLALHPNGRVLYAVNEVSDFDDQKSGSVSAFAIDRETGKLTLLNTRSSRGGSPCYIVVDKDGKHVLVANYSGGNLAVLPIGPDGSLGEATQVVQHTGSGPNERRQRRPHAHSVDLDAASAFAISADLGADRLFVYRYDAGTLTPASVPSVAAEPGAGPRHFAFHPGGRFGFAANELSSTLTAYAWDAARGELRTLASVSTLPAGFSGDNYPGTVIVHPGGRFVYLSNRGHDSIAVFEVNAGTGAVTPVQHESVRGRWPRHFNIHPGGEWLVAAGQRSDSVAAFRIDRNTGRLFPVGDPIEVGSPSCVLFVP
ncbi:MAG TPA: lactonase family protein [Vicinamibacterales bacterium]